MEPRFNLVEERWIPVITSEGKQEKLGLKEVMLKAHQIRELYAPSPLVTASLHRLLLALLHRVYGPYSEEEWDELYKKKKFEPRPLKGYLDEWRAHFWLFHSKYPFYQYPNLDAEMNYPNPISILRYEFATGNNPTLFDHNFDSSPIPIDPDEAARLLVAFQSFALAGGNSKPFYFQDSPLSRFVAVFVLGDSLFQTLMLNLIALDEDYSRIKGTGSDRDIPFWETSQKFKPQKDYSPKGYIDYLTLPSRRVLLIPDSSDECPQITYVYIRQGHKICGSIEAPFSPYNIVKKERKALRFRKDRAVWRDCIAWMRFAGQDSSPPKNIWWVREFVDSLMDDRQRYKVQVVGLVTVPGKQKVEQWSGERIPLPLAYLKEQKLVESLQSCLTIAEGVSTTLYWVARDLTKELSTSEDAKRIWEHFNPQPYYWSGLEPCFYETMDAIAELGERDPKQKAEKDWAVKVYNSALDAFKTATNTLDRSAKTLKAVTLSERKLERDLLYNQKWGKREYIAPLSQFAEHIKEVKYGRRK